MASSYYPITTDNYFDNTKSQSITSYPVTNTTNNKYHDDSDDDDLDALRKAALNTLNSNKRKNTYDNLPIHRNSRSSSRSYSSSRSSYSRSSISRSYSSSSLSSISSNSLNKHDKDYRFETKENASNGDIDERFPQDIPNDDDALIVNCPIQDDDLLTQNEHQPIINHLKQEDSKRISDYNHKKLPSKKRKDEHKKSPSIERPVSITVKLNSEDFDLRQLIKKRRTTESVPNNQRIVQILPKDGHLHVHKTIHDRSESRRSDKQNYHKH
ncbi:unnamed protein product [Rotaria magnacalcarata]|uniref:Uncharacterized protein n=4 Tax=Rotaria magnacalcarata TaxID=392030 RepID=A0A816Q2G3_9BILA|nr:unnamed protein product [Rotaria magnacalcarata]CAF4228260.1 unnamed protein product [Rotaria magnacalcarata]